MAKDKSKSGMKNKHLHARIAFLHKAATYLTDAHHSHEELPQEPADRSSSIEQLNPNRESQAEPQDTASSEPTASKDRTMAIQKPSSGGLPLHLSSHLSQVARKSQIRLSHEVKHSICKRCGTVQAERETCKKFTENLSKGGKKPHADVLVQECGVCGAKKRWPVGARRQKKKNERAAQNACNEIEPQLDEAV